MFQSICRSHLEHPPYSFFFNRVQALYREGIVLSQLRRLKLCSCTINWSKLLVMLLKDSPNLQELEIHLDGVSFFETYLYYFGLVLMYV